VVTFSIYCSLLLSETTTYGQEKQLEIK